MTGGRDADRACTSPHGAPPAAFASYRIASVRSEALSVQALVCVVAEDDEGVLTRMMDEEVAAAVLVDARAHVPLARRRHVHWLLPRRAANTSPGIPRALVPSNPIPNPGCPFHGLPKPQPQQAYGGRWPSQDAFLPSLALGAATWQGIRYRVRTSGISPDGLVPKDALPAKTAALSPAPVHPTCASRQVGFHRQQRSVQQRSAQQPAGRLAFFHPPPRSPGGLSHLMVSATSSSDVMGLTHAILGGWPAR